MLFFIMQEYLIMIRIKVKVIDLFIMGNNRSEVEVLIQLDKDFYYAG